jgi:hypothetical protein
MTGIAAVHDVPGAFVGDVVRLVEVEAERGLPTRLVIAAAALWSSRRARRSGWMDVPAGPVLRHAAGRHGDARVGDRFDDDLVEGERIRPDENRQSADLELAERRVERESRSRRPRRQRSAGPRSCHSGSMNSSELSRCSHRSKNARSWSRD